MNQFESWTATCHQDSKLPKASTIVWRVVCLLWAAFQLLGQCWPKLVYVCWTFGSQSLHFPTQKQSIPAVFSHSDATDLNANAVIPSSPEGWSSLMDVITFFLYMLFPSLCQCKKSSFQTWYYQLCKEVQVDKSRAPFEAILCHMYC